MRACPQPHPAGSPSRVRQMLGSCAVAMLFSLGSLVLPSSEAYAGKSDDTLNVAFDSEVATLDYYMSSGRNAIIMSHHLFDTLLYKDVKSGEILPALAKSYKFVDDTTIEFELREGVTFHDGSPMTADDVVYTLNKVSDKEYGAIYQIAVKWIDGAEKLGDYRVRVKMKEPYPVALEWVAGFLPIYPSDYYEKVGKEGMALKPVGTGPYKLKSMEPGAHWALERFEGHYKGSPKGNAIKNIDIRVLPEMNTQLTGLITGKIDFIWKYTSDVAERLAGRDGVTAKNAPIMRIIYLAMNTVEKGPIQDIRVRRALNHAINKQTIVKALVGSGSDAIDVACNPIQFGCMTDVTSYGYDPEKARALLAEAGYGNGLKLEMLVQKASSIPRNVVEAVMADLAKVGVTVETEAQPWAAARKKWVNNEDDVMLMSWGSWGIGDAAMITSEWFGTSEVNRVRDEEVIDLLNVADTSIDRGVRQTNYAKALRKIADQAYWTPMWTYNVNYALSEDVSFTLDQDEIARFFNATWK